MQTRAVTQAELFSANFTRAMLIELAVGCGFYSQEASEKLADQNLSKPSKTMAGLDCPKLRTILDKKLHDAPEDDFGHYKTGEMDYDFNCLPDLDIGNAGKNTKRERKEKPEGDTKPRATKLTGAYEIVKQTKSGTATNGGDEGMYEIWKHVWECRSFEEYFAVCPKKAVKRSGTVVTAASEIGYALRSGFIRQI